mgnify:CR=1 FL=1
MKKILLLISVLTLGSAALAKLRTELGWQPEYSDFAAGALRDDVTSPIASNTPCFAVAASCFARYRSRSSSAFFNCSCSFAVSSICLASSGS